MYGVFVDGERGHNTGNEMDTITIDLNELHPELVRQIRDALMVAYAADATRHNAPDPRIVVLMAHIEAVDNPVTIR